MNLTIKLTRLLEEPIIEHCICSFASVKHGSGKLIVMTNIKTSQVNYKIIGNNKEEIVSELAIATRMYNLLLIN